MKSISVCLGRCETSVPAWINYQNVPRHFRRESRRVSVEHPFEAGVDISGRICES